jgi:inner membrane protein
VSSFIGHGLAAAAIVLSREDKGSKVLRLSWAGWLVLLAWTPDIDYLIAPLRDGGIRRTHSVVVVLLLPPVTAVVLWLFGMRGHNLTIHAVEAGAAGLSHLALDMLVGVTALPLLWPMSRTVFRLPFGILPSAGRLDPQNPLLWRNWLIELGVLVPVVTVVWIIRRREHPGRVLIPLLLVIAGLFMAWAGMLQR